MSISKNYSLNTKITLSFITLGFLLLSILFIQIIPNMQDEQEQYKKNEIEHMIVLTKEQLKLAVELLIRSNKSHTEKIETKLSNLVEKYNRNGLYDIKSISLESKCETYFFKDKKETFSDDIIKLIKKDGLKFYFGSQNHMCPKITKKLFFVKNLNDKKIILECSPKVFPSEHINLEKNIKKDLEKSFDLTYKDHKGKINLMWINTKHNDFSSKSLYNIKDKPYNKKYCLSKMSSSLLPNTGKLTGQQIVDASDKEPIKHILNNNINLKNQKAITWIRTVKDLGDIKLLFLTTIYKKDIKKDFYAPMLKVFPAAIFALVVAILLGFFLFRRLFKSINILTTTASEINKGNMNLRSNIKGNDDIAILGKTFDNMLDSIEQNIKTLDKKVEDKTKELSCLLEAKEVLLKEIHHRVKNNLAMTINLIKLQKSKIEDEKTKEILVDIQERIFTMELLHRKLYETKDLNLIPIKKYVCELSEDLNKTYASSKEIEIKYHIEDINMSIEYALPCGLIITECLTNAYKYAFEKNKGVINIIIKMEKNECTLIITDNGIGLPSNMDINKSKTLGFRLISSIVKGQLLGTFNYIYKNGSNFYINFNIL